MKKDKQERKKDLVEDEKKYIQKTDLLEKDHHKKQFFMMEENVNQLGDMEKKYQSKLSIMK